MLTARKFMRTKLAIALTTGGLFIGLPAQAGQSAQSLGGITLTEVAPRVVTPNGDMLNDVIYFKFGGDSVAGLPIESQVYDIHGAKVTSLVTNASEDALVWDGKDNSGRNVPSGIYIYSIKLGDRQASGTVVVAR